MDESAAVTAIMPVKDTDPLFFHEAVKSMHDQTCPRWALLLVAEPEDVDGYVVDVGAYDDDRISVVANEGPRLAGAVNTGMRRAETDFVALLLADDRWAPEAVEVLDAFITRDPAGDFFHSGRQIIDDDGVAISSHLRPRREVRAEAFVDGGQAKHLLCWRRAMGLAIGGLDERSRSVGPDDYDFPWTMAEHGARFVAVDAPLYLYRDHRHGARLTTHLPLSIHRRELHRIMRKHGVGRPERRRRVAAAQASYLQQCLYRNRFERWWREALHRPPPPAWREEYP